MPTAPPVPLAVDLNVFKLGTAEDPVTRDDVERALYALTGWQKPQHLVDAALDVVDAYATGVRAGRVVPARAGHSDTIISRECRREHLDEHVCPVTVKTVEVEVEVEVEVPVSRSESRSFATKTPAELMAVEDPAELSSAQANARDVLLSGMQPCAKCGEVKPLAEFYRDRGRLVGRASRCKGCANVANQAWRRKR